MVEAIRTRLRVIREYKKLCLNDVTCTSISEHTDTDIDAWFDVTDELVAKWVIVISSLHIVLYSSMNIRRLTLLLRLFHGLIL